MALFHRNTTTSGEQLKALINQPQFQALKGIITTPDGTGELKYRNLRGIASKGTNEAILDNEKFGAKSSSDVSLKFSSFKKQIAELRSNDSDEELSHGNTSGL